MVIECVNCSKQTSNAKFCSRSCAASFNNKRSPKRSLEGNCFDCGVVISSQVKRCLECREQNRAVKVAPANLKQMAAEARLRYLKKRRQRAKDYLGGRCRICATEDNLEFDHIHPASKEKEISAAIAQCWSWDRLEVELDKCQLLCEACHRQKTSIEQGVPHGGGLSGKRNCKCRLCKDRKNERSRKRKSLQGGDEIVVQEKKERS